MSVVIIRPESTPARNEREQVELKLGYFHRLWNSGFVRKAVLIVVLGLIWEGYARYLDNSLLFPTLSETLTTLVEGFRDGPLVS